MATQTFDDWLTQQGYSEGFRSSADVDPYLMQCLRGRRRQCPALTPLQQGRTFLLPATTAEQTPPE